MEVQVDLFHVLACEVSAQPLLQRVAEQAFDSKQVLSERLNSELAS